MKTISRAQFARLKALNERCKRYGIYIDSFVREAATITGEEDECGWTFECIANNTVNLEQALANLKITVEPPRKRGRPRKSPTKAHSGESP